MLAWLQHTYSMTKKRSRLLTHNDQPPQHEFVTFSNTSRRVRRVFTSSASTSTLGEQQNEPEENLLDYHGGQLSVVDDLDGALAGVDYHEPAQISVRTKAKRYQNSVRHHFLEFSIT